MNFITNIIQEGQWIRVHFNEYKGKIKAWLACRPHNIYQTIPSSYLQSFKHATISFAIFTYITFALTVQKVKLFGMERREDKKGMRVEEIIERWGEKILCSAYMYRVLFIKKEGH